MCRETMSQPQVFIAPQMPSVCLLRQGLSLPMVSDRLGFRQGLSLPMVSDHLGWAG